MSFDDLSFGAKELLRNSPEKYLDAYYGELYDETYARFGPKAGRARPEESFPEWSHRMQKAGMVYINDTTEPGERDAIRDVHGDVLRTGARTLASARALVVARERGAIIVDNDETRDPEFRGEHLRELPITERFAAYKREKDQPLVATVVPSTTEEEE